MGFEVCVTANFSSAHRVRRYTGEEEPLHGHNYTVEVCVQGEKLDENGMLVDFGLLKSELKKVVKLLDHTFLNENPFFKDSYPTAENLCVFFYENLKSSFQGSVRLSKITVWENQSSKAVLTL